MEKERDTFDDMFRSKLQDFEVDTMPGDWEAIADRLPNKDVCPQTRWVEGSNFVDVNFKIDPRTKRIIMMGAMDNLVKGAAGQAVQNMNLLFGLDEKTGLQMAPLFP